MGWTWVLINQGRPVAVIGTTDSTPLFFFIVCYEQISMKIPVTRGFDFVCFASIFVI